MKIVKIWGGLGNQLFQYYFSLYLLKNQPNASECRYFTDFRGDSLKHNLSALNLTLAEADADDLCKLKYKFGKAWRYRLNRFMFKWFYFFSHEIVVENDLINRKYDLRATIYDGYWQDIKYLESTYSDNPIMFDESLWEAEQLAILNNIKVTNSVSIHVRRGDKLEFRNRFRYIQLKKCYYQEAINYIKTKIDNPVFFIFSDDIDYVRRENWFSNQNSVIYVSGLTNQNSLIFEFMCMSKCVSNIISNSTFSWWGAWINVKKDKIVVAPKQWYRLFNVRRIENFLPKNWIIID